MKTKTKRKHYRSTVTMTSRERWAIKRFSYGLMITGDYDLWKDVLLRLLANAKKEGK